MRSTSKNINSFVFATNINKADNEAIESIYFGNEKIRFPNYFEQFEIKVSNINIDNVIKEITSKEFIAKQLIEKEKKQLYEQSHKLYAEYHNKENHDLSDLEDQIKKLNSKIRFSPFNKKDNISQRDQLVEKKNILEEEIKQLKIKHHEIEQEIESLEEKYKDYVPNDQIRQTVKDQFLKEYKILTNVAEEHNKHLQKELEIKVNMNKKYDEDFLNFTSNYIRSTDFKVEALKEKILSDPANIKTLQSMSKDTDYPEDIRNLANEISLMQPEQKNKRSA